MFLISRGIARLNHRTVSRVIAPWHFRIVGHRTLDSNFENPKSDYRNQVSKSINKTINFLAKSWNSQGQFTHITNRHQISRPISKIFLLENRRTKTHAPIYRKRAIVPCHQLTSMQMTPNYHQYIFKIVRNACTSQNRAHTQHVHVKRCALTITLDVYTSHNCMHIQHVHVQWCTFKLYARLIHRNVVAIHVHIQMCTL